MQYNEMRDKEKTHVCAECGAGLVTVWEGETEQHRLVCSQVRTHIAFQELISPGKQVVRGQRYSSPKAPEQKALEKKAEEWAPGLSMLPTTDLYSGASLSTGQVIDLVVWGKRIGLKPYLGHVCLYYGKPYVTIDGYYYLAAKSEQRVSIGTRPATPEERAADQVGPDDLYRIAEGWIDGKKVPETGIGIVTMEERLAKSKRDPDKFASPVVAKHPARTAEKRAEWQLLRKLIPLEDE